MDLMNPHQSTNDVSPLSHRLLWWLLRRITSLSHANQTTLSRWLARLSDHCWSPHACCSRQSCHLLSRPQDIRARSASQQGGLLNHSRTARNTDRMGQARAIGEQASRDRRVRFTPRRTAASSRCCWLACISRPSIWLVHSSVERSHSMLCASLVANRSSKHSWCKGEITISTRSSSRATFEKL